MKNIFAIYFAIGSFFAVPMSLSYIYAEWFMIINFGWKIFSLSGLTALLYAGYLIIVTPVIRGILWLPSLIMWFYIDAGQYYSFFKWLAPGFYVSVVQVGG